MGINARCLEKIIESIRGVPDARLGSIVQLGRQSLIDPQACMNMLLAKGFTPKIGAGLNGPVFTDVELFRSLGFSCVNSIDISMHDCCDIQHDMNKPLTRFMKKDFDVVFNGGTLEHIYDVPQALSNISGLLSVGGFVIHGAAPCNNYVDHGFYQFSPTFFHDYYTENKWNILELSIFQSGQNPSDIWTILEYDPNRFSRRESMNVFDAFLPVGCWVVAQKTKESTHSKPPNQGKYKRAFGI